MARGTTVLSVNRRRADVQAATASLPRIPIEWVVKMMTLQITRTIGFPSEPQEIIEEEDNNVPEEWNKHMSGSNITFEDFVTCDDEIVTAGTLTEEEILESVNNCFESDKDDEFDDPQTSSTRVSINEAKRAVTTVQSFIEQ
ncbi:hypothetical protein WA026_020403 [Henosepilachna vigintioctopunctata]|uniref:Uncharacterized protein n=1 Tax=Henosepilachna vigintioctopunctata TaxID=420089 RepID=A0AAW1UNA4_9CUCU